MNEHLNFSPFQRLALLLLGGGSILAFILSHRGVTYYRGETFYPRTFQGHQWFFWLIIVVSYVSIIILNHYFLKNFEKQLHHKLGDGTDELKTLGLHCVRNGIVLCAFIFLFGFFLILIDTSLLNVWDVLFLTIFIGLYYIGVYIHFYYSVPLMRWKADDPSIELEKLKIEYDEQRMYLRIFLWITVSFLVSQVFVVLKSSFEPYLKDPDKYHYLQPIMVINAFQICFLIVTIWALVFSRVMCRIEEVKFNLMSLKLDSSNSDIKDKGSSDTQIEEELIDES